MRAFHLFCLLTVFFWFNGEAPASAEIYQSRESALRLAFPGASSVHSREIFLSAQAAKRVEELAGHPLPTRMITVYEGEKDGRIIAYAYIETHRVRSLPETVMVVLTPGGKVQAVHLLAFHEPSEYEPPASYLRRFRGLGARDDLTPHGGVPIMAGATFTSTAILEAVRRILAIHEVAFTPGKSTSTSLPPADRTSQGFSERMEWVMGTRLRIVLPAGRADIDSLFRACFAQARRWDALLSPWNPQAPLSRLSAAEGKWVEVPEELIDYLELSRRQSELSGGIFDITLRWRGWRSIDIDRAHLRARWKRPTPEGLDPGGNGKGVALDAMARILDAAGVHRALLDFGASSLLARGDGPQGPGWLVSLNAPPTDEGATSTDGDAPSTDRGATSTDDGKEGKALRQLRLRDSALSVSSTTLADHGEEDGITLRYHLRDLRDGTLVRAARTVAVLAPSAAQAEVFSTSLAILGPGEGTSLVLPPEVGGIIHENAAETSFGAYDPARANRGLRQSPQAAFGKP